MRPRILVLVCLVMLVTVFVAPQTVEAADGDSSPASITSFAQTSPNDSDFWPDGTTTNVANTKWRSACSANSTWYNYDIAAVGTTGFSGDYMFLRLRYVAGHQYPGVYSNLPSFTSTSLDNCYFDIYYKGNSTGQTLWYVSAYSADGKSGTESQITSLTQTTSWTYRRVYLGTIGTAVESVAVFVHYDSGQPALELDIDFIGFGLSTAGGWEHDCSATGNTTAGSNLLTSDGDKITISRVAPDVGSSTFSIDTTTIAATLDSTYFPMLEISVSAVTGPVYVYGTYGVSSSTLLGAISSAVTTRYDLEARLATDWTGIQFTLDQGDSITLDSVAAYTLANFSITVTGGDAGDVAYVSSNALVVDKASATLFQFNRDPTISVASGTYPRWNLTTATPDAVGCSLYIASWTTKDGESTWAMPSGTSTDVIIRVTADATISALKFLVDTSVPVCLWSYVVPTNPAPGEPVTLSAVITDTYPPTVYKVYFRPLVYPAGFSAIDYEATEQSNNVWNYTFSSLPLVGYYVFAVIGTDGANNNTLGATTYLTFSVTESSLSIITEAYDVQDVWITFVVRSSLHTATFYIWDNDTLVGSSYEGAYQIAKPSVIGLHNYTILCNSSQTSIDSSHQTKNFVTSDDWAWLNYKFTVNPVELSFEDVSFNQNNESVVISCRVYTSASILYYTVYEANLGYSTGTISGVTSASWLSWMWDKSDVTSTNNYTVALTDGTYNVTFRGFYLKITGNQWITYGSMTTEDHRTYIQNSTSINQVPSGLYIDQATATVLAVGGVIIAIFAAMTAKEVLRREILKGIARGLAR